MKRYAIKSMFYTLQGEGVHSGQPAVFIRFSGCNFWNGRPEDRASSACPFCDTDFVGTNGEEGGRLTSEEVSQRARELGGGSEIVVLTGGEPLLQVDQELVTALKSKDFKIHIETNGSKKINNKELNLDWVTCSPKSREKHQLEECDELKVIYPAQDPLFWSSIINAKHHFIQPEDGPGRTLEMSSMLSVEFAKQNPGWRVSVQTHKILGIQ